MATFFLSSCQKDEINPLTNISTDELSENQENYEKVQLFFNDEDFANKTEEELIEYIQNLSSEEVMNSKNDYLVAEYLTSNNLFNSVISEENAASLSKMDLSNFIDDETINEIYGKFYTEEALNLREDCLYKQIITYYSCTKIGYYREYVRYDHFLGRPIYVTRSYTYQGVCSRSQFVKCN